MKQLIQSVAVLMLAVVWALSGSSMVRAQVSAQSLKSISIPDKVTTSIGPLDFFDGVPTDATIQKVYDNLDRARALEVYLGNLGSLIAAACSALSTVTYPPAWGNGTPDTFSYSD